MIGVILWHDEENGKAVLWCEDQGELVYHSCEGPCTLRRDALEVGDVVRFDVVVEDNLRRAKNISKLLENWGSFLNDALTRVPDEPESAAEGFCAKVVPLRSTRFETTQREEGKQRRRHG